VVESSESRFAGRGVSGCTDCCPSDRESEIFINVNTNGRRNRNRNSLTISLESFSNITNKVTNVPLSRSSSGESKSCHEMDAEITLAQYSILWQQ
jgi:hypothetical protein